MRSARGDRTVDAAGHDRVGQVATDPVRFIVRIVHVAHILDFGRESVTIEPGKQGHLIAFICRVKPVPDAGRNAERAG